MSNAKTENAETGNAAIENALTIVSSKPPAIVTDGWDMAAVDMSANPFKGMTSVNFDNGAYYTGKEKTLIEARHTVCRRRSARRLDAFEKGNAA